MEAHPSFHDLLARLRGGDAAAAEEVFRRYAGRLIALARSRLDAQVRRKLDPEDVLQSVFRSFFLRQANGQFDLAGWDGLWAVLVVITLRKCGRQVDFFRAAKRSVRREVPLAPSDSQTGWEALAREPTPDEAVILCDTVDHLLRESSESDRAVLTLALQGFTGQEIADQIGCTERTVRRVLARARERLERPED